MKIGFIGYGNMAQAIAQGLTRAHAVDRNDIVACAAHFDKLERNIAAVGGTAMHTRRRSSRPPTWWSWQSNRIRLRMCLLQWPEHSPTIRR